jgi:hypothetical protein
MRKDRRPFSIRGKPLKYSYLAGGLLAATLATATAAQAETLTYNFDQAFWGTKPHSVDSQTWQDGKKAAVAADPSAFTYLTGSFDYTTGYVIGSDFSLNVDYGPHNFTFTDAHISGYPSRSSTFTHAVASYSFEGFSGPVLTSGNDSGQQYKFNFTFAFTYWVNSKTIDVTASGYMREFVTYPETTTRQYNPYLGWIDVTVPAGGYYASAGEQVYVQTFGTQSGPLAGQITPAVPLPAGGLLILSAFGAAGAVRLRKRAA